MSCATALHFYGAPFFDPVTGGGGSVISLEQPIGQLLQGHGRFALGAGGSEMFQGAVRVGDGFFAGEAAGA